MKWIALFLAGAGLVHAQSFSTGQAARLVIGQTYFTAEDPGTPVTQSDGTVVTKASAKRLGGVSGLAFAADTLYVADSNRLGSTPNHNRVLLYQNFSNVAPAPTAEVPVSGERCVACIGEANLVLGQSDFEKTEIARTAAATTVRSPTGVASDGKILAVADTDFNRVLIWKTIPAASDVAADLVLGQADFTTVRPGTSSTTLRGPQGLWIDARGGLWVADTGNNRVLYYGVPTRNGQEAALVLGQPDFGANIQPRFSTEAPIVQADSLLAPVSVTSDGTRLYVADLGLNRVLIWNTIPASNRKAADVVLGQPDFASARPNYSEKLCASNGTNPNDATKLTYPDRCAATMVFPRYALSDGTRLFLSDGGNDRVLVYNAIPTTNGARADVVLGQPDEFLNQASDSAAPERVSAADSFRTPNALAYDGVNLYVADTYNRRVVMYTPGDFSLPISTARNLASPDVFAIGRVLFGGTVTEGETISVKIGTNTAATPVEYKYTIVKDDTFDILVDRFLALISANAGDPNVYATPNKPIRSLILTARQPGPPGNDVTLTATVAAVSSSTTGVASTTASASSATLAGGEDAARIAPYTLVTVLGENLADQTASVDITKPFPYELGGVQVTVDGIRAPIAAVAPDKITIQIPVQVHDPTGALNPPKQFGASTTSSSNVIVRTVRNDGRVTVSTAAGIPIISENPGVFAEAGSEPRAALAYHFSSGGTATVSVDGQVTAGNVATVVIENREYSYTAKDGDDLGTVRNALVDLINNNDPSLEAFPSGTFTRIRLRARVPGPEGNGIAISTKTSSGSTVIVTALNNVTCCANIEGAPVTLDNPALPGETIVVYGTGLGIVKPPETQSAMLNGQPYAGNYLNEPLESVSSLVGGKTANVLFAGLKLGAVGVYEVHLELNSDMPTDPKSQGTIAQNFQVSNIFTIPVVNPKQQ